MTDVWLVRHGETEWSRTGRHTGRTDIPLDDAGREAAAALRPKLAGVDFAMVLTSPLSRARETARLAGFPDAVTEPDLQEWDYGAGEGLVLAEIQREVPNWRIWTHGAPQVPGGPVGESKDDVRRRLDRVIARVRDSDVERVLLFGHGHALRVLTALWCGFPVEAGAHFPLQTASLGVLGYEKTTPAIVRWNV